MPERIQRLRVKGWRKPKGAVIVDRTTNWGNPYEQRDYPDADNALLVSLFRDWLTSDDPRAKRIMQRLQLGELTGKDLVCWCAANEPCHADVLLELANR